MSQKVELPVRGVVSSWSFQGLLILVVGRVLSMIFGDVPEDQIASIIDQLKEYIPQIMEIGGVIWTIIGTLRRKDLKKLPE